MDTSNQVKIFDTTLRDGQQCPGAGMSFEDNLTYARLAAELGVDALEAGFPSASDLDFEIVHTIAQQLASLETSPIVVALCQLRDEQIDRTIESLLPAIPLKRARLHTYIPVDPGLMSASLGSRADQKGKIVEDLATYVARAVSAGVSVEFSPEGYSRMGENFDFVTDLIRAAISAGAAVINCPDTIGSAYRLQGPEYFVEKIKLHAQIMDREFPGNSVTWSVHCHNDFGLAVDNSLNGIFFGPARQIEGCINGVGERAGNAALEQCILLIKHFSDMAPSGQTSPLFTGVRSEMLQEVSDFIDKHMLKRQAHWPIVGRNAACHSSGGHTNAILRNPLVYQPFDPKEIGGEITLAFGPLSGGNHAKSIINACGYECSDAEKSDVAQHIKVFFKQRRKGITDEELMLAYFDYRKPIKAESIDYSKTSQKSQVSLLGGFFSKKGEVRGEHQGKDSALAALKALIDEHIPGLSIQSHRSRSKGEGVHAVSASTIVVSDGKESWEGRGEDQDIEISAMRALIDAVNRCYIQKTFRLSAGEQDNREVKS